MFNPSTSASAPQPRVNLSGGYAPWEDVSKIVERAAGGNDATIIKDHPRQLYAAISTSNHNATEVMFSYDGSTQAVSVTFEEKGKPGYGSMIFGDSLVGKSKFGPSLVNNFGAGVTVTDGPDFRHTHDLSRPIPRGMTR